MNYIRTLQYAICQFFLRNALRMLQPQQFRLAQYSNLLTTKVNKRNFRNCLDAPVQLLLPICGGWTNASDVAVDIVAAFIVADAPQPAASATASYYH